MVLEAVVLAGLAQFILTHLMTELLELMAWAEAAEVDRNLVAVVALVALV